MKNFIGLLVMFLFSTNLHANSKKRCEFIFDQLVPRNLSILPGDDIVAKQISKDALEELYKYSSSHASLIKQSNDALIRFNTIEAMLVDLVQIKDADVSFGISKGLLTIHKFIDLKLLKQEYVLQAQLNAQNDFESYLEGHGFSLKSDFTPELKRALLLYVELLESEHKVLMNSPFAVETTLARIREILESK